MPQTSIYICLAALLASTPVQSPAVHPDQGPGNVLTTKAMTPKNGAPEMKLVPEGYGLMKRKDIREIEARKAQEKASLSRANAIGHVDPLTSWQEKPLGLLVNFGLYSHAAGQWKGQNFTAAGSEMLASQVFADEYGNLFYDFKPSDFDPQRIARLAAKSGLRVVFTAKHHDGFCLFKTSTTSFNSFAAPQSRRDFVAELAEACRRENVPFGLFYSLNDWHYPQASGATSHHADPVTPEHLTYIKNQLEELLTHYTAIDEIWFDGGSLTAAQSKELRAHVKFLQPDCLIGGLGNDYGDFTALPEYAYPDLLPDQPWQWADRMYPGTWGYRNWQQRGEVDTQVNDRLKVLQNVVTHGGNYMISMALNEYGGVVMHDAQVVSQLAGAARRMGLSTRKIPTATTSRTLSSPAAPVLRKAMPLTRANAVVTHALTEVDDYYAAATETAWEWTIQDYHLRKVSIDFAAADLGSFLILEVDGKTYDVELLPEVAQTPDASLGFRLQQYAYLPFRENALPTDLASYMAEKKPFFVTAPEGFSADVRPMTTVVVERSISASAAASVPVDIIGTDAVEIYVNGEFFARHLNRSAAAAGRKTSICRETVLLPLVQGPNKVLLKSYSRWGGPMKVAVQSAEDQQIYRCDFWLPDILPGARHQLRVSRKHPLTAYSDARLHNLTLMVF